MDPATQGERRNQMIDGLDHVHILCGDVEKSVRYFEAVFGGKVESRGELRGFPMIRMDVKGVFLNLMGTDPKAAALEAGKGSRGLDHFGFKVKDRVMPGSPGRARFTLNCAYVLPRNRMMAR